MSLKGLYAITDEYLTPYNILNEMVEKALQNGIKVLQFRDKKLTDSEAEPYCRDLQALCKKYNCLFIIDDRPYLADKINADGLHLGKDDMNLKEAKKIFTKGIIGVSCYGSIKKAIEAQKNGASYVAFGSFYQSPTKPRSGIVPHSILLEAKKILTIPICAIGGINIHNIHEIASCNPDMISVVSAIWDGDVEDNIIKLKQGMLL